ncbi:thymidine phosphorylase [Thalassomonas haliotis]|uniref:Thymidine phosphorylase n=1 Tax=Thalassomonas haliotis TaxID=485448 RepID=A0ABY7VM79_9GAMM|nr:thymidine phosphorylase [Thalassomonas haliotis]WDE14033.1 thymidine phosphorylase [Thalassomonas haliotis]
MLLPQEIIRHKRDGLVLAQEEIQAFIDGLVSGSFTDAQVGAMAMCIYQQGMTVDETVAFTNAMKNSGDVLSWPELDGPIVDKHSTGGVGDKVSFMLSAIVAACGGYVPMISGRGLGHTGGTVDKLESIAGFNVQPSLRAFKSLVAEHGLAIISQTSNLAPADKRLYGVRDITATVDSIPLITASILSKKLSAGLDALVMDIKVGNGAMMTDIKQANALAQSIVNVATGAGVKTEAIITDMNQVLGSSAGNALEIKETVDYLTGEYREPRLHQVTVSLACAMLQHAGLAVDESQARAKIEQALSSGKAAEKFADMIAAMGGPGDLLTNPWASMPKANVVQDIIVKQDGYINGMQTRDIGMAVVALGGGRLAGDQQIDHSVGFDAITPLGSYLKAGDVIARVHAKDSDSAAQASARYLTALEIGEGLAELPSVIYHSVNADT